MNAEEAIMIIQAIPEKIWNQMDIAEKEAINMGLEALEKQIPKKPKVKRSTVKIRFECPSCLDTRMVIYADGYRIGYQPKYCEKCGQKLDWSK